jgi:hypothetical protein
LNEIGSVAFIGIPQKSLVYIRNNDISIKIKHKATDIMIRYWSLSMYVRSKSMPMYKGEIGNPINPKQATKNNIDNFGCIWLLPWN